MALSKPIIDFIKKTSNKEVWNGDRNTFLLIIKLRDTLILSKEGEC